jgi:hypothetical protein
LTGCWGKVEETPVIKAAFKRRSVDASAQHKVSELGLTYNLFERVCDIVWRVAVLRITIPG